MKKISLILLSTALTLTTIEIFGQSVLGSANGTVNNTGASGDAYATGRFGVGTTTPAVRFHVFGPTQSVQLAGELSVSPYSTSSTGTGTAYITARNNYETTPPSTNIAFRTLSSGTLFTNVLITNDKKFGINMGSNTPSANFDVRTSNSATSLFTVSDDGVVKVNPGGLSWSSTEPRFCVSKTGAGIEEYSILGQSIKSGVGTSHGIGVYGDISLHNSGYGVAGVAWDVTSGAGIYGAMSTDNGASIAVRGEAFGSAPTYGIYGSGSSYAGYFDGDVHTTGIYTSASDARLKQNISSIDGGLTKIMKLQPKSYNFRTEEYPTLKLPTGLNYGFIAQDLEKVFPEMVKTIHHPELNDVHGKKIQDAMDYKGVNYMAMIPIIIEGMQEQQAIIESQKTEIDELKSQVEAIKRQINGNSMTTPEGLGDIPTGKLLQNYPNPSGSGTTIEYVLPSNSNGATIYIYDLQGKQLAAYPLHDGGEGKITISAKRFSAGTYLYTLVSGGMEISTKKMILTD